MKCYTCIHYEDVSRYDPSDDTDWPQVCEEWEEAE